MTHHLYNKYCVRPLKIMTALVLLLIICCKKEEEERSIGDFAKNMSTLVQAKHPDKAFALVSIKMNQAKQSKDSSQMLSAYISMGDYYRLTQSLDTPLIWYQKALPLAEALPPSTETAYLYQFLGYIAHKKNDYITDLAYLDKALAISRKLGDSLRVGQVVVRMGLDHLWLGHKEQAYPLFEYAQHVGEREKDSTLISASYHGFASHAKVEGDLSAALAFYKKSLEATKKEDTNKLTLGYLNVGAYAAELGSTEEGLAYLQKGVEYAIQTENKELLPKFYANMANIFARIGKLQEADEIYTKIENIAQAENNYEMLFSSYIGKGTILHDMGKGKEALVWQKKALKITETHLIPQGQGIPHITIAEAYYLLKSYDSAEIHIAKAMKILVEDKYYLNYAKVLMGKICLQTKKYTTAENLCMDALAYAQDAENLNSKESACECLYQLYKQTGQYEKSLDYLEQLTIVKDSMFSEDKVMAAGNLQASIQFEKEKLASEYHIMKLNKEIEYKNNRKNLLLLILALVLGFTGFLVYAIISIGTKKKKLEELNLQVSHLNTDLEKLVQKRTKQLIQNHENTLNILQSNSHNIRNHVARILGLIILYKKDLAEVDFIMLNIDKSAEELNKSVNEINYNLYNSPLDFDNTPPK